MGNSKYEFHWLRTCQQRDARCHFHPTSILIPISFLGCPTPQRIASYSLSPNRQRPLAGTAHAAFFNTFRRFRHQILYVAPPFIIAYAAMDWAVEKYVLIFQSIHSWLLVTGELVTNFGCLGTTTSTPSPAALLRVVTSKWLYNLVL